MISVVRWRAKETRGAEHEACNHVSAEAGEGVSSGLRGAARGKYAHVHAVVACSHQRGAVRGSAHARARASDMASDSIGRIPFRSILWRAEGTLQMQSPDGRRRRKKLMLFIF